MEKKTFFWAAGVLLVVALALGLWAFAMSQPLNTETGIFGVEPWTPAIPVSPGEAATQPAESMPTTGIARARGGVVGTIDSLPASSEFQSLLRSTGVAGILESGEYTVFVPTNGAFGHLPSGTISNMTSAQLRRLVEYHIVSGTAIQTGTEAEGSIQALSGDPLNFSNTNNIPMVDSSIIAGEYRVGKSIIYVINAVLLPPQK